MKRILFLLALLAMIGAISATVYLSEGFETDFVGSPGAPAGWSQSMNRPVMHATTEKNWMKNTYSTAWAYTGGTMPTAAHGGTGALWIDDYNYNSSSTPQNSRRMESPALNLSASTSPYVRFWYFNNQGVGITLNMRVMVSGNGGATWDMLTPIVNGFNTANTTWNLISVAIPAEYRTGNFKIGFEITNRWGTNNPFIDDVSVEDYTPTTIVSAASGDWNAIATWVGGVIPTTDNHVEIAAGHTVTVTNASSSTGILARCQNLTVNGTLAHGSGTANLLHAYGDIVVNGTFNAFNGTSGRPVYLGGSFTVNSGGTATLNTSTTAQSTATITITTAASTLVFLNNQPGAFTNNGTLTGGRINNILHIDSPRTSGSFVYNSPVTVPYTFGLYLGTVNPNGNLTLGNAATTAAQTIERANGSFTNDPIWGTVTSRSNTYYTPNWVPLTQETIQTGNEIELLGGVRTVSGAFTMNTHNNLQVTYPLTLGTATTGTMVLTRGIVITDETNYVTTSVFNTSTGGTTPSTATPPTTHGSYFAGPLRRTYAGSGTVSRVFPLGVGTAFNGATPNSNVIKSVTLAPGTAGNQSPTLSIVGPPTGTPSAPLTSVFAPRAYRVNLNGGPDFLNTATLTLNGMNYTYGNSDNLLGAQSELRIAQSTTLTGGNWAERSTSSGTGAITPGTSPITRTTATTTSLAIAPIAVNGEYFAWASTLQLIPNCTITPSTDKNFGAVQTGTYADQVYTISNSGGSALSVSSVALTGTDFSQYDLINSNGPSFNIPAGSSATVTVRFQPSVVGGPWPITLVVNHNATPSSNSVNITGSGFDATIYTMPWSEDFGTTGTTFPPTNWTRWSGLLTAEPVVLSSSSGYWLQDDFANVVTDPTNKSARLNICTTTYKYWLITPPIQMPGAGYQLEFDLALTDDVNALPPDDPAGFSGVDDKFVVMISDGNSWSLANAVKVWDNDVATTGGIYEVYNDVPHTGSHYILPLDAFTGIKYIAFYGESTISNADNDFFVDNVMVRQTPAGAPGHVTLVSPLDGNTSQDPANVQLSWTASLEGISDHYNVYVSQREIVPTELTEVDFTFQTTVPNLDLTAQPGVDLGYGTTWYWAVLPFNAEEASPDPEQAAFMVWDFTTLPDPSIIALPYSEFFDTVTAPALPWGWSSVVDASTTAAYVNTYSSTTYAVSGTNSARLYNSTDVAANLLLITPDFTAPLHTIKARFYARSSSAGDDLYVGTYNPTTEVFTQVGSVMDLTTTQTQYTVPLSSYVGTDTFLAFKHGVGTSSRTIYIDNVEFIEMLVNDLAASSLTGPSYLESGTAYDYTVNVVNEGTAAQAAYVVNLKSGPTTLATLNVSTPLASGDSVQHTLSWTPTTGGVLELFGEVVLATDQFADNNVTSTINAYIVDNTMSVLYVGNDATTTSGYYVPINLYYRNSVTEELYFNDEMHLQTGSITALVYKNTSTNARDDKAIKIWMAHTTVSDLSGGWLPMANYSLVFDGTVDFPAGVNYVVIPLDTPFDYTGGTIATRVYRVFDPGAKSTSEKFYYTTNPAHTVRSRYLSSDSTTYDPTAPSANGTSLGYFPNTMFVVQNAVLEAEAVLSGHVYEGATTDPVAGATVTLTDERYSTTTDAAGFYEFRFWEAHTVGAVASKAAYYSQSVTGLALTMGIPVTQNFNLTPMPRLNVTGMVNANDAAALEGATIELMGAENYEVLTLANGTFSIPNVLGSSSGITYSVAVSKLGYQSYAGSVTVYATAVNLGTITLTEYLWTPYNLVATHNAGNASLTWDPAGEPDYFLFDFEADNGGWVGTGYGDWEWTNAYTLTGYTNTDTYADVPPTAAHSGTGLWATKVLSSYSNSTAWSYLRQTVDLAGFTNPVLSIWHYMNGFNTYDYGLIKVNGTTVWGSQALASFMPWQLLTLDLSAYTGMSNVEISFEWYATGSVNYAGWYLDDIYIGPAITRNALAQLGSSSAERSLQNYDVFRMLTTDEGTPLNWISIAEDITATTCEDTGFATVPGARYKWAVKANYTGGLESNFIFSNTLGKVYNPQDIAATKVGTSVVLSWTPEPGATYYKVYAADDPYGTFTYLGYNAAATYTVTAPAAKKFYKVTAVADEALPTPAPAPLTK